MPSYLLNWNPKRTFWTDLPEESARSRHGESVRKRWSTGVTKRINPGDRVFLIKQGVEPKGIIASGIVATSVFQAAHWSDSGKQANYVNVNFDSILNTNSVLPRAELIKGALSTVHWDTEGGGITIEEETAALLEDKWQYWLDQSNFESGSDVDERFEPRVSFEEGSIKVGHSQSSRAKLQYR